MSFWDEHSKAEAEHRGSQHGAQNAPMRCSCGHLGQDVFFGTCLACFKAWEADHAEA